MAAVVQTTSPTVLEAVEDYLNYADEIKVSGTVQVMTSRVYGSMIGGELEMA